MAPAELHTTPTQSPSERSPLLLNDAVIAIASDSEVQKPATANADHASAATELKELLELAYPVIITASVSGDTC